jgi:hypothetical protein
MMHLKQLITGLTNNKICAMCEERSAATCKVINDKKKNKTIPHCRNNYKINIKIVEKYKIDTPNTGVYYHSLSCLGTGTSIQCGGVKLTVSTQASCLTPNKHLSAISW